MASSSNQNSIDHDTDRNANLYKAAVRGDWKKARGYFDSDQNLLFAKINPSGDTVLHAAAWAGQTKLVKELLDMIPPERLVLRNNYGDIPFHVVCQAGDTEAAEAMVLRNPDLPQIRCTWGGTPILVAASNGNKDLLWYLCEVTKDEEPSPFREKDGVTLLNTVIYAGFYDVALYLLQHFPQVATGVDGNNKSALETLAKKSSSFMSGSRLAFWQRCIYKWVHVDVRQASYHLKGDTEDPPLSPSDRSHKSVMQQFLRATHIIQVLQSYNGFCWNAIKYLVPGIKQIHDTKLMHYQTQEIVQCICAQDIPPCKYSEFRVILEKAAIEAAKYGSVEVVNACLQSDPTVISWHDPKTWLGLPHMAIIHRQSKVFKLLRGFGPYLKRVALREDVTTRNNILHLAATLSPSPILNSIPGAPLQMQRELQWYKEVEKITQPKHKESLNSKHKTPPVLFTEEHKGLLEKGEKWMKETASSCMVVATLIATVAFAAAFTVPGGNNDDGMPFFLNKNSFILFAIADALALFSSTSSVLMFLSILTSRYAEEDFLRSLPKKLIIGLSTLFFSITTMMMAFSTTFFIMVGHQLAWVSITVAIFATFPVFLFALSHFTLLVEMIISTYGSNTL